MSYYFYHYYEFLRHNWVIDNTSMPPSPAVRLADLEEDSVSEEISKVTTKLAVQRSFGSSSSSSDSFLSESSDSPRAIDIKARFLTSWRPRADTDTAVEEGSNKKQKVADLLSESVDSDSGDTIPFAKRMQRRKGKRPIHQAP